MAKSTVIKTKKTPVDSEIKKKTKIKTSGGSGSRNTRQGFRSEYIVKYIFTAFGTAVNVSAENDLGIDLLCNLTTFVKKLIIFKSTYGIQVRSTGKPFKFIGTQATKWLSSLEFPILLVDVDKPNSRIKVYSTWNLNSYILGLHSDDENDFPKEVLFDTTDVGKLQPANSTTGVIPVGKPILDFHYSEIDDAKKLKLFHEILTEWLEMDDYNYKLRRAGVSRTFGFISWTTNQKPSIGREWDLRYIYSPFHNKNINKLTIQALTVQGIYNKDNSLNGTKEPFKTTFNDLREYVKKYLWNQMEEFERNVFKDPI